MNAEILLYISKKDERDIFFKCLAIECVKNFPLQETVKIFKHNSNIIKIQITMPDASKIRAVINSYIRLIQVIYNILKIRS